MASMIPRSRRRERRWFQASSASVARAASMIRPARPPTARAMTPRGMTLDGAWSAASGVMVTAAMLMKCRQTMATTNSPAAAMSRASGLRSVKLKATPRARTENSTPRVPAVAT